MKLSASIMFHSHDHYDGKGLDADDSAEAMRSLKIEILKDREELAGLVLSMDFFNFIFYLVLSCSSNLGSFI